MKRQSKPRKHLFMPLIVLLLIAVGILYATGYLPLTWYGSARFGIETVQSSIDFDQDGVDDYRDVMLGARQDARNHPAYDDRYWEEGYPPDDIGVCTDVVWRAFRHAGYSLRDMVDADIAARPEAYPRITQSDSNIDFRRVYNLRVFFDTYAIPLSLDPDDTAAWQPGDIVIWGADKHIGIVSDRRNAKGHAFVIHNSGQPFREQDALTHGEVTGHFRFDASLIDRDVLAAWRE